MSTPHDPFSARFDAIEIDPARAPSHAAIDHALSFAAPTAAAPDLANAGFYLIDDAGGRFTVDRDFGVVSLKDESLLTRERNTVYAVKLRVVESSGSSYDLDLQLRLTGHVPQVVGAEEFGAIAALTTTPIPHMPAPTGPRVTWNEFAPSRGAQSKPALPKYGAYGELLHTQLPIVTVSAPVLNISDVLPEPYAATAAWSL
jgi:hypothetical protein